MARNFQSILGQQQQQVSDSQCTEWTYAQIYAFNPHLKIAESGYHMSVSDAIGAYCMEYKTNKLRSCDVKMGHSAEAFDYKYECTRAGGVVWQYNYSPKCKTDKSSVLSQHVKPVLVCASPQCTETGVGKLIPAPELLDSMGAAGYSCGSGFKDLEKAPLSSSGSTRRNGLAVVASAIVAASTALFAW